MNDLQTRVASIFRAREQEKKREAEEKAQKIRYQDAALRDLQYILNDIADDFVKGSQHLKVTSRFEYQNNRSISIELNMPNKTFHITIGASAVSVSDVTVSVSGGGINNSYKGTSSNNKLREEVENHLISCLSEILKTC